LWTNLIVSKTKRMADGGWRKVKSDQLTAIGYWLDVVSICVILTPQCRDASMQYFTGGCMHNRDSASEIRGFIRWALDRNDIDLLDDANMFLHQLYMFAKMSYGGREFWYQLDLLQKYTDRLIKTAEKRDRTTVPIALHLLATNHKNDRTVLDWARLYVPIACDYLDLDPLQGCSQPCRCSTTPSY
jgi:hypothetical protein